MKIDFDGIQAFVVIAELGGFNKAADQLHITQTALTRRVQKLESYLELRLFDRTTRHVELTAVGREFLPKARYRQ
jgi:DNA-binding transcriptional LysR family regulator